MSNVEIKARLWTLDFGLAAAHQLQFTMHHRGAPEIFSRREILTTNDRALIRYITRKTSNECDLGRAGRRLRGDDSGHDLLRLGRRRRAGLLAHLHARPCRRLATLRLQDSA